MRLNADPDGQAISGLRPEVFGGWLPHRLLTTPSGVALSWRAPAEHRGGVWLKRVARPRELIHRL
jgi:hypothetical protein